MWARVHDIDFTRRAVDRLWQTVKLTRRVIAQNGGRACSLGGCV